MSQKDRERLKVLHEVRKGHITQVQAGKELGITPRGVRELLRRMKVRGDRAVVHGLRGEALEPSIAGGRESAGGAVIRAAEAGAAGAGGTSAPLAAQASALGRVVAMGHQHSRLAGRARGAVVSDRHDRRCHLSGHGAFHATAVTLTCGFACSMCPPKAQLSI